MGKHSETCQKPWKRCQTTKNQPRTTIGCIPDALGGVLEHFGSSVGLAKSQCSTNAYRSVDETRGGAAGRSPKLVEIRIHPFAENLTWIPEVA